MPRFDIQSAIETANNRLKSAAVASQIRLNGQKLVIRATVASIGAERL
jgi:hypothetical protein